MGFFSSARNDDLPPRPDTIAMTRAMEWQWPATTHRLADVGVEEMFECTVDDLTEYHTVLGHTTAAFAYAADDLRGRDPYRHAAWISWCEGQAAEHRGRADDVQAVIAEKQRAAAPVAPGGMPPPPPPAGAAPPPLPPQPAPEPSPPQPQPEQPQPAPTGGWDDNLDDLLGGDDGDEDTEW